MTDVREKSPMMEMILKLVENEIGGVSNFNGLTTRTQNVIGNDDNFRSLKKYLEMRSWT